MSVAFKLADHPRRKALTEKLTKLRDGLCASMSSDEICQKEIERETAIISKAMDRLADYASKSQMVDVVEGLLERKACGSARLGFRPDAALSQEKGWRS